MTKNRFSGTKKGWYAYLCALLLWPGFAGHIPAQEQDQNQGENKTETDPPAKTAKIEDPGIAPGLLKITLLPLTAPELKAELSAWLDLLQEKAIALSEVELALSRPANKEAGKENTRKENTQKAVKLREEKAVLIEKVRVVIAAASAKGVDTKSAELYVGNVSTLPVAGGVGTLGSVVKNWFVSPQGGIKLLRTFGLFLLCVLVAVTLGRIASGTLDQGLKRAGKSSDLLRSFLVNTIRRVALVVGLVVGVSYLGVNIGPMVAAIGGVGFVVGFALKDSLGNFASGLMILFYRPFDVGHYIKTAGVSGTVESLSLVSTILKTPDTQEVNNPHGKLWDDVITNVTAKKTRRVDFVFGVGYDDDLNRAQSLLEEILGNHELVLEDPAPMVKVNELADSSINFIARPWVNSADYWTVYWDIIRRVKEGFDEAGISIPYPQQDVHVFSEDKTSEDK